MDLELIKELNQIGINAQSLSKNEEKYLSQIYLAFKEFMELNNQLNEQIKNNKFNKSIIINKIDCSRQTLYNNPTLMAYLNYCINRANNILNKISNDCVSKEKYNQLKYENEQILLNIVEDNLKDDEIERLSREVKEKDARISNLVLIIEELNKEITSLKKNKYN